MTVRAVLAGLALGCLAAAPAFAGHELEGRDIEAGKVLYVENCAACHGAKLEGQPNWRSAGPDGVLPAPPHDETGHTWHHDNGLLFDYTRLGGAGALEARGLADFKSGMPAFEGVLSDDQIWDTLAYIASTWPEGIRDIQKKRNPPH
ncbi:Cytochrome c6 [Pseudoruegeria aquimaris]|uniref:Cytochrome c6 n=1 Tax=Pseudoruegeria aquimaris TaxID=393663 RepID=A0A1Y5TB25_9RHOB|nr:cytochrome c [Pseudoruegeria aquimaris]SLN56321.1 Cytochrome c6 [Pseudoruegeria aquimaris]